MKLGNKQVKEPASYSKMAVETSSKDGFCEQIGSAFTLI